MTEVRCPYGLEGCVCAECPMFGQDVDGELTCLDDRESTCKQAHNTDGICPITRCNRPARGSAEAHA